MSAKSSRRQPPMRPIIERILDHTEIVDLGHTSPCWLWTASLNQGYGQIGLPRTEDGRRPVKRVHLVAYELLVGEPPYGHELDHLCHSEALKNGLCAGGIWCEHRRCWNPDHLEAVTRPENVRRSKVDWCVRQEAKRQAASRMDG